MPIPPIPTAILLSTLAGLTSILSAHDPITTKLTWSKEISRLLKARCIGCHQSGGAAPFSLATYAEARPWAVAIRDEVTNRRMPPWNAVRGFGSFSPDSSLTQEEIQLIVAWVNGGAPEGDSRFLDPTIPALPPPATPPPGSPLQAADGQSLPAGTLSGFRILALPVNTETRLLLQLPDGRLQPLAWLRAFTRHAPALYAFAEPVNVPRGSTLRLWASPGARLELFSSPSPNRPSKHE